MRYLSLAILLVFARGPEAGAQTGAQPRPLRLTAEVLARRLCAGGAGVNFLHIKLRLRFTNVGDRRLILYRGNNLFFTLWVNSNPARPSAAQYELKTSTARFRATGPEDVDRPAPGKDFVPLPPGAKFETDVAVSLPVACEGCALPNGAITAGEHLLRVTASTWYESKALGEKLRERWRRKGELWLNPVVSEPVRFGSGGPAPAEGCQGPLTATP